ncbi:TRAP transporter small permease [Clostridiales bacterium F-3ap]|uniref:TRAP transporter small permease n=2 Tax=Anaerotalea alkaliphila TaxID=2662126 RepID=A0A7X5HVP7_9FIRM|nr:TRAP transporter small permease [Anaerotalea alkaliphila]
MKTMKIFLNRLLSYLVSLLFLTMTFLVLWQVFTRYVLGNPSMFTEELVLIILVWTAYLGAAYAFGKREHMSLVFLKERMTGTRRKIVMVVIDASIIAFSLLILIYGGYMISESVFAVKTPILGFSRGMIYIATTVSGVIITLLQVINIVEDIQEEEEAEVKG